MKNTGIKLVLGAAALSAGYTWLLGGRRGQAGMKELGGWIYAHRGYHHEPDAPENSLEAFRLAVENRFGIELDVHLLADGNLAVVHDSMLKRMTGRDVIVEMLREEELTEYKLGNSTETIPTFKQVLETVDGKVPLIIELKPYGKNYYRLCRRVFEELDLYKGSYCVESFHPQVVYWLRKNRPEVIRGQLSQNYYHDRGETNLPEAFGGTELLANVFGRPDFVAYRFKDRHHLSNQVCVKLHKLQGVSWTLKTKEELKAAQEEGYWPIFENFDPKG